MKNLVLENDNSSFRVEYVTSIEKEITGASFTIMKINGLDDNKIKIGVDFQEKTYEMKDFIDKAVGLNLKLSIVDQYGSAAILQAIGTALNITTTSPLTAGNQNVAYSTTLNSEGGNGSYTYSLFSGAFPTGISISSSGVISGTPTVTGTFNFTIRVTDGYGGTFDKAFALTINI